MRISIYFHSLDILYLSWELTYSSKEYTTWPSLIFYKDRKF